MQIKDEYGGMPPATVWNEADARGKFFYEFEIPKKGISEYGTAQVKLEPLLESSELIKVEYELPFGLNAEPQDGRVVVTKEGAGGEQVGDVLRFFNAWKQGQGGFSQPELIDVDKVMNRKLANGMKSQTADGWEKVVAALCSNDGEKANSIVMLFERQKS